MVFPGLDRANCAFALSIKRKFSVSLAPFARTLAF